MSDYQAWVDLSEEDFRNMLISLIGYRFGREPEKRLDEIRAERSQYIGKFIKMAGVRPSDTVLELGSGCGFGTRALSQQAGRVLACDISPAYLSVARKELHDLDNIEYHLVKSRDLSPIADSSVDKVLSVSVFIHFNLYDIYIYFKEFNRVVKDKGKVIFDFADQHRIAGSLKLQNLTEQFLEHVEFYGENPSNLPSLVQWNSAKGIENAARLAGFKKIRRRGQRLLFERA
jgi:ubiquinone/menaquinone biosynthesis C-methylase UbiE